MLWLGGAEDNEGTEFLGRTERGAGSDGIPRGGDLPWGRFISLATCFNWKQNTTTAADRDEAVKAERQAPEVGRRSVGGQVDAHLKLRG